MRFPVSECAFFTFPLDVYPDPWCTLCSGLPERTRRLRRRAVHGRPEWARPAAPVQVGITVPRAHSRTHHTSHTHTHTHSHTHACWHTCTHTRTHYAHTRTIQNTHTHTHSHTQAHTHSHTHTHTYATHTHTSRGSRVCVNSPGSDDPNLHISHAVSAPHSDT